MAQAQGSFGRMVIADEIAFKSAPELVLESCEIIWDELVDADVTASADAVDFKVGTKSAKFVVAAGASGGDILATHVISAASLANYTHIGMWIKSSVVLAAGDLKLLLDDTAQCASPLEAIDIPAVPVANVWTWVKLPLANPATDLLLISIGIKMVVDKEFTLNVDDIRAIKDGLYLPFLNESLRMSRNLISSQIIRSSRNPNMPVRGNREVAGDITTELNPYMGRMFKHLLGSYSVAGAGSPYTHTFKIGTLPEGMQIEKQFSDIAQYFRYNGCKINSMGITVKPEGFIETRFSILGAKETVAVLPQDGSPTDFGHPPFDGVEAVIKQGGVTIGVPTDFNFTIENNLDGSVFVIDGTGERYSIPAGIAKVSGQLTALFDSITLYNLAVANTESTLQVIFTKGTGVGTAGNEKLTFNFDEIIFKPQAPVIGGPTGVVVELPFEAYYNDDADASAVWIELMNAQALL